MKKVSLKEELMIIVLGLIGFILASIMCELWSTLYWYTELGNMLSYRLYTGLGYAILIGNFSLPFHVYFNIIK